MKYRLHCVEQSNKIALELNRRSKGKDWHPTSLVPPRRTNHMDTNLDNRNRYDGRVP